MDTQVNQAKLFAKIAAVMSEVRTLEKTGENKFDKYSYVTADAIAIKVGGIMAKHKLALLPSLISVETGEYTTQKGGTNFRTVAHFQMTLACGETGATWTSQWSGEAIDRSDKSISKAAVSAVKYFLLKTFLLAGGDEEDADAESPTIERASRPQSPNVQAAKHDLAITELDDLGAQFYGAEWPSRAAAFALSVSKKRTSDINHLNSAEIAILVDGINKKMDDIRKAEAAA
jgi:hypothetical protein